MHAQAKGFVLRFAAPAFGDKAAPLDAHASTREGRADGEQLRLVVRPQATTPEAEREQQPIVTPFVVLTYSGRIDNREEIAHSLGRPRLVWATDGVLFAEAYATWGEQFPAKVLGEYSVALLDRFHGRLVAARDSLGLGRLFRYDEAGAIWLASSLEMLLGALPKRPTFDRRGLAEYIAGGGVLTSGRTIYDGIREVPAAHVLTHNGRAAVVQRYWQPDPERRLALRGAGEYDEAFRCLLFAGVRASLRSNTPVWSDLSGGLDSSAVTAAAALLERSGSGTGSSLTNGLGAFSVCMSDTLDTPAGNQDESESREEFLAAYPIEQHRVDVDQHPLFDHHESPSSHPAKTILYRPIADAAAKLFAFYRVGTHLTGRGGNQLFCGDGFPPLHLTDLFRGLRWSRWLREASEWVGPGQGSYWKLLWNAGAGASVSQSPSPSTGKMPRWLAPGFIDQVRAAEQEPWRAVPRLYDSPARELQYRSILHTANIARFIRVADERHPLLYRPLVEFALALPWEHLLRPDQDRIIQRRALRGILPERIRLRTAKGSSTSSLLLRGLRESWPKLQPLTHGRRLAQIDLVHPPAFQAACDRLRHGLLADQLRYITAALSLEIWLRANATSQRDVPLVTFFSAPQTQPCVIRSRGRMSDLTNQ
jgi:asparagine synthase (glutamine-hydrolysing)